MDVGSIFLSLALILFFARVLGEAAAWVKVPPVIIIFVYRRVSGVFDNDMYAVMIITIAASTILPPFILKWFYGRFGRHLQEDGHVK